MLYVMPGVRLSMAHVVDVVWQACTPSRNTRYPITGAPAVVVTAFHDAVTVVESVTVTASPVGVAGAPTGVTDEDEGDHADDVGVAEARTWNTYARPLVSGVTVFKVSLLPVAVMVAHVVPLLLE